MINDKECDDEDFIGELDDKRLLEEIVHFEKELGLESSSEDDDENPNKYPRINNTVISELYYDLKFLNFACTEMRNLYLKIAEDYFDNGNYKYSAYYQFEALCFQFNMKYKYEEYPNEDKSDNKLGLKLPKNIKNQKTHSNPLVDHALEMYKSSDDEEDKIDRPQRENFCADEYIKKDIEKMMTFNEIIPDEWTVVHLCKGFNPDFDESTRQDLLTEILPIYFTVIKHPRSNEFPKVPPIIVKLDNNFKNLYEEFYNIRQDLKTVTSVADPKTADKRKYKEDVQLFDKRINEALKLLSDFIGPWMCFFTGSVNESDKRMQRTIFNEVDKFCRENTLNTTTRILLSMLVSQNNLKYLTEENCKEALKNLYVEKHKNVRTFELISEFLMTRKNRRQSKKLLNPCILIIDEFLDHIPWEMINRSQDICRISSYNILKELYEKHESNIKNGYLQVIPESGHCIINPQKNLPVMEQRMKTFFNYWLPKWRCYFSEIPELEEIKNIFTSDGIYVFCGHGSGRNLLKLEKNNIRQINKSVAFLFGCDSVKLNSPGTLSEFRGDHLYFHACLCPAIIGFNNIGLDFPLDNFLSKCLSTWIYSDKDHWDVFDKLVWRKKAELVVANTTKKVQVQNEPRLSAILSQIRCDETVKLHSIIALTYRGLPVWNNAL